MYACTLPVVTGSTTHSASQYSVTCPWSQERSVVGERSEPGCALILLWMDQGRTTTAGSVLSDMTEYGPRAGHPDCWSAQLFGF